MKMDKKNVHWKSIGNLFETHWCQNLVFLLGWTCKDPFFVSMCMEELCSYFDGWAAMAWVLSQNVFGWRVQIIIKKLSGLLVLFFFFMRMVSYKIMISATWWNIGSDTLPPLLCFRLVLRKYLCYSINLSIPAWKREEKDWKKCQMSILKLVSYFWWM